MLLPQQTTSRPLRIAGGRTVDAELGAVLGARDRAGALIQGGLVGSRRRFPLTPPERPRHFPLGLASADYRDEKDHDRESHSPHQHGA